MKVQTASGNTNSHWILPHFGKDKSKSTPPWPEVVLHFASRLCPPALPCPPPSTCLSSPWETEANGPHQPQPVPEAPLASSWPTSWHCSPQRQALMGQTGALHEEAALRSHLVLQLIGDLGGGLRSREDRACWGEDRVPAPGRTAPAPGRIAPAPGRTTLPGGLRPLGAGPRSLQGGLHSLGEHCGRSLPLSPQSATWRHSTALSFPRH